MELRKGPYGYFVVNTVRGKLNKYATEIINYNILDEFMMFYIASSPISGKTEISYDCTNYVSCKNRSDLFDRTNRSILRKATGDLFLTILRSLDYLLPIEGIYFNPEVFFWDTECNRFKICYNPYLNDEICLKLSTLGNGNLEKTLTESFFSEILSSDEISSICMAVNSNNEQLLEDTAISIKNTDPIENLRRSGTLANKYQKYSTIIFILFLLNLFALIVKGSLIWLLGLLISLLFLYRSITDIKENQTIKETTKNQITSNRKKMLFDEDDTADSQIISCLFLKSKQKINGSYINKAIYTNKAVIGSDKILSDICIDDNSISDIHVEIEKIDDSYYLRDISWDNETYIENRKILPDKQYEVKNGQTIRCGNYDFEISIGL